jgi:hypothetical protein
MKIQTISRVMKFASIAKLGEWQWTCPETSVVQLSYETTAIQVILSFYENNQEIVVKKITKSEDDAHVDADIDVDMDGNEFIEMVNIQTFANDDTLGLMKHLKSIIEVPKVPKVPKSAKVPKIPKNKVPK